jgi:hypothetical protein
MDRDGFISNGELFLVLKMMVGNNLKVRRLTLLRLSYSSLSSSGVSGTLNSFLQRTGPTTTANRRQECVFVLLFPTLPSRPP